MQAEPQDQEKLLALQAEDNMLAQLAAKKRHLPEEQPVVDAEAALALLKANQREQLGVVDELRAELRRAESDVELVQARIAKDSERLVHTSSAKDAQGLEHELSTLKERLSLLEEVELGVMERLEAAEQELAATDQAAQDMAQQLSRAVSERDAALATLEASWQDAVARRKEIAQTIPAELLALYERQRERYGVGASHLQRGISGASGVKLTESDLHTIRNAAPNDVVLCPDSNAILVRTAESGL